MVDELVPLSLLRGNVDDAGWYASAVDGEWRLLWQTLKASELKKGRALVARTYYQKIVPAMATRGVQ